MKKSQKYYIKGYGKNYIVSKDGTIYSTRQSKNLTFQTINPNGQTYSARVSLTGNKKKKWYPVKDIMRNMLIPIEETISKKITSPKLKKSKKPKKNKKLIKIKKSKKIKKAKKSIKKNKKIKITKRDGKLALVISDCHIPAHDKKILSDFIQLCKDMKPNEIILLGDILDFHLLSRFKSSYVPENLLDSLDIALKFINDLRKASPKSKIVFVEGNHSYRLMSYIDRKCPELIGFASTLKEKLGLKDEEFIPYSKGQAYSVFEGGMIARHEPISSSPSMYQSLEKSGVSQLCGHLHRAHSIYCHDFNMNRLEHHSVPCSCDVASEALSYTFTYKWSTGFSAVYYNEEEKKYYVEHVLY